ncbi:hypothetical protein [Streptomyces sp. NPDC059816]|uniref:hypothetical protein n=1 Tax=Streptomyces sp. NPDC059816 TaxID=3346960 RepID=UPI003658D9AA
MTIETIEQTPVDTADEAPPKDPRRGPGALVRWAAAVLVFAAAATGIAYGLTTVERAEVPGLATDSDGRWDYPRIERPALPEGSPAPFAEDNPAAVHHAPLRELLLPAPRGSVPDPGLKDEDGWLPPGEFAELFTLPQDRAEIRQQLIDYAVPGIAARGWTTPDGTRTRVYLLRFGSAGAAESWRLAHGWSSTGPVHELKDVSVARRDTEFPEEAQQEYVTAYPFTDAEPQGRKHTRLAFLTAGDTVGLVIQSRAGGARDVPFQQTVTLQGQLLG